MRAARTRSRQTSCLVAATQGAGHVPDAVAQRNAEARGTAQAFDLARFGYHADVEPLAIAHEPDRGTHHFALLAVGFEGKVGIGGEVHGHSDSWVVK